MKVFHKKCFRRAPVARDSDWKWLQLRREAAARRSVPKNSASSGKAHLPGGEHSECVGTPAKPSFTGGNKTPTVRRRTATGKHFSSGEEPLHGGAFQKIASAPGKPISPEENIQNVWELRRSLRSPEEMTNGECFLLPSPLCIMEQRDCNHE